MVATLETLAQTSYDGKAADLLCTEHYTIYPYLRGSVYPPDTLYALYRAMAADPRSLHRVLYESERIDLPAVIDYFANTLLYLAVASDKETILGAVWFTAVTTQKAQIGIWYSRGAQGPLARQMTNRVCEFVFLLFRWRAIFGLTPWKAAVRHGQQIGFTLVATVPDFVDTSAGYRLPLYVICRENRPFTLSY